VKLYISFDIDFSPFIERFIFIYIIILIFNNIIIFFIISIIIVTSTAAAIVTLNIITIFIIL